MHHQGLGVAGEQAQAGHEVLPRGVPEVLYPGGGHEGLEPDRARLHHAQQLGLAGAVRPRVPRNQAAPEPNVHQDLILGDSHLFLEDGRRRRRWLGVQGHVQQCGDPSGRRGPRRGLKALPVRPPGLVDVDVEVHQARGDHEVAVVQHQLVASAAGRLRFGPALDRHDPAAVHAHCCRECTPRGHHSVAEHEVLGLVSQQAAGQRPRVAGSGPGREDALRHEREAHHEDLNDKDDQEATRRVASHILLLLGAAVPIGLAICIAGRPRASGSQPRAPPRHRLPLLSPKLDGGFVHFFTFVLWVPHSTFAGVQFTSRAEKQNF